MKALLFCLTTIFFIQCPGKDQVWKTTKATFTSENEREVSYQLMLPKNYKKHKRYPLFIGLHDFEQANQNLSDLKSWFSPILNSIAKHGQESIILLAHCTTGNTWSPIQQVDGAYHVRDELEPTSFMVDFIELIDATMEDYAVDHGRVYPIGVGMGGFGAIDLLHHRADLFAAALVANGAPNKRVLNHYMNVPIWLFQEQLNPKIPVFHGREFKEEMEGRGMEYEYIEYKGHSSSVLKRIAQEPGLLEWIFSKRKITPG